MIVAVGRGLDNCPKKSWRYYFFRVYLPLGWPSHSKSREIPGEKRLVLRACAASQFLVAPLSGGGPGAASWAGVTL